jgi:conjugal transfer pilus assembly protein TraF
MTPMFLRACAAALMLAFLGSAALATTAEGYYQRKEEGWFWYKDPKERKIVVPVPPPETPPVVVEKKKEEPPKDAKPAEQPKTPAFSVKWIRENLDKLRDIAIDDPSVENVRNYYYAQRVLMDRADNFARVSQQVTMGDPLLDENNNFPYATAASQAVVRIQEESKVKALKYLAGKTGIWFFFSSECMYCEMQVQSVQHLQNDYGFIVKAISLDGKPLKGLTIPWVKDSGQYKALNLNMTPTIVLASPPKDVMIISQGLLSDKAADERVLLAAKSSKLLPHDIEKEISVFERGIMTNDDLGGEQAKKLDPNNPGEWVEYLRSRIRERY